jgi:hypothetical protein
MEAVDNAEVNRRQRDIESRAPRRRLLNLNASAYYLGVSYWTMRDYVQDGVVPAVKLPCARRRLKGGVVVRRAGDVEARRILIDIADLDALIARSKGIA